MNAAFPRLTESGHNKRGAGDRVTRMVKLLREDATADAAEAVPQEFRA
jgi:hypothetical protein